MQTAPETRVLLTLESAVTCDDNGNVMGDGQDTYGWNARDELASITGGQSASFAYDAFGRRVSKAVASSHTRLLYDGANPVQELDAGGTATANLVGGLGPAELFALVDGSGTHSLLTEALGSTLAATDASGTIEAAYTYEPFGKASQTGPAGAPIRTRSVIDVWFTEPAVALRALIPADPRWWRPTQQAVRVPCAYGFASTARTSKQPIATEKNCGAGSFRSRQ